MPEANEILLIEKSVQGDEHAFSHLVRNWRERLYRFAFRYMQNPDDAHDIVQQTFIKVHKNLNGLENPERFSSWVYKITLNLCRDELRRKSRSAEIFTRETEVTENQATYTSHPASSTQVAFERQNLINRALQFLPEDQRAVLLMKEYQGLKFREIAVVMDISENTAKSRLYYALKAMQKNFKKMNINREELL